jgi:diacylglycerol O-acyltransferase
MMSAAVPDRLTTLDAAFLHFEHPWTPMHVAGLYIFEGTPEIPGRPGLHGLFHMVEQRLPLVPRYRQRVVSVPLGLGQPLWVDDPDFDLSYHLRRAALPAPGGTRELLEFVARIHARPLDRSRPLWEIYVIEGLEDGRLAMYSKVHHAMIDGMAGIDLATVILDTTPEGAPAPSSRPFAPPKLPGRAQLLSDVVRSGAGSTAGALRSLLQNPRAAIGEVASQAAATTGIRRFAGLLRPAPTGPLNVPVGPHRRLALVPISLVRAKAVKNKLGGTVNDVVLTAVGEAVDHFLEHRNVAHEEQTYRVLVPVSVRDESQRMTLGNRVAAMFVDLPVGPMPARRRLATVSRAMTGVKENQQALAADRLIALGGWAPATLHGLAGRIGFSSQRVLNLVVSNVPGVQYPLYAGGARLLETYPLLPLAANLASVVCVTSYCGTLYFGLVGDRDAVPDLDVLARGLRRGFDRLEIAAHQARDEGDAYRPSRGRARTRTRRADQQPTSV